MLRLDTIKDILKKALSSGGDFAEIFMEDRNDTGITLVNSKFEKKNSGRSCGIGLRVYKGLNSVYSYTNDLSYDSLMELANSCASTIGDIGLGLQVDINLKRRIATNIHDVITLADDVLLADKIKLMKDMDKIALDYDSEIDRTSLAMNYSDQNVLIANSDGLHIQDRRVYTKLRMSVIAKSGEEMNTAGDSIMGFCGYEAITNRDTESFALNVAKRAKAILHAKPCKSGVMPVAIESGFGGVIFHEACAHSLEATAIAKGRSVFCGKLGQKIAHEKVNAVDDGTIKGQWGSINIDDEGNPSQRNVLIENGILKGYLVDRLNGRRMNMPSTGSGRRQSYKFAPTSRMTNTFILAGNDKREDIIKSIDNGLYAKEMGGGSVNPITGEFNFFVAEGYLIENGKIQELVKGASLIGKGHEILHEISMISDNLALAGGMCGSLSGSIPVTVGQPLIKVDNITVGGK